jgi:putative transposase
MKPISYAYHRFPPDVIRHAVWLYLRFTLSYRDVEDLLAERGLMVSNESIRRWVLKFGPVIAKNLRGTRPKPHSRWHLDEMVVSIAGRQMYMWRAVDSEGEVLEILVQPQRDKTGAGRLLRTLLRRQGFVPAVIITDKLRSYGAALREIGFSCLHEQGLRANNRAERGIGGVCSHMHLPQLKRLKLPLELRSYFYPILDQTYDCRHAICLPTLQQSHRNEIETGSPASRLTNQQ